MTDERPEGAEIRGVPAEDGPARTPETEAGQTDSGKDRQDLPEHDKADPSSGTDV